MAVFNFDQVDEYVQSERSNINFFKLDDDGWQAKVRFMYGPNETFQGYSVHNIAEQGARPKYVPCLRELGQPLDACPLCASGSPTLAQFFIPLFVISVTQKVNGVLQPEQAVNEVMIFQRGKLFKGSLDSAIRQSQGTPLVNNIFNIVRNGKKGNNGTTYSVEFVSRDSTSLESLPERPQILGSFLLPDMKYDEMVNLVSQPTSGAAGVIPRMVTTQGATQTYQAPNIAPTIPGARPF